MTLTRARTIQYIGVLLALSALALGYWYFSVRAGVKTNTGAMQSQGTGDLSAGLAGYWKLDENTGTSAADSSTNSNAGTLTNGPTWATGQIGSSVTFDGTNDSIVTTTDHGSGASLKIITLSAWFKTSSTSGAKIIGLQNTQTGTTASNWDRQIWVGTDGKVYFGLYTTVPKETVSNTTYNDNLWHHAVGVSTGDNGTITLYVDGVLQQTTSLGGSVFSGYSNSYWRIGDYKNAGWTNGVDGYFTGSLDEIRVYDRALSADEVANLYRLTTPTGVDTSLKGYWSFNGDTLSGSTAYDRSGAGNAGTLTNGPVVTDGRIGQALDFDGSNDYILAGSASSVDNLETQGGGGLTASAWIYPESGGTFGGSIVGKRAAPGPGSGDWAFVMHQDGDAIKFYKSYSTTVLEATTSSGSIALNRWQFVTVTWDGTASRANVRFFIDGVPVPTSTTSGTDGVGTKDSDAAEVISISAQFTQYEGKIDEVRLYNRILAASEIKSQYDRGASDKTNTSAGQAQGTGNLNSGLSAYWKLDENTGTSAGDASTNANTGTLTNGPTWSTGQIGSAVTFDGTNDEITTTNNQGTAAQLKTLTLSAWFKTSTASGKKLIGLENTQTGTGTTSNDRIIWMGTDGKIRFGMYTSTTKEVASTTTLNDNAWHHAVGVSTGDNGTIYLYIDGALQGTTSLGGTIFNYATTSYWRIGGYTMGWSNSADGYYTGQLDEVRVYDRPLSADEVSALYRLTTPTGVDTGLKGYWSFNGQDLSGTTAYDRSGAGNTGTLTNGPVIAEGRVGQALSFDGTNDYMSLGSALFSTSDASQAYTLSAWIKTTDTDGSIIDQFIGGQTNRFIFHVYTDGKLHWTKSGTDLAVSSTTINDGQWHFVTGVKSGSGSGQLQLYVDGVANGASGTDSAAFYNTSTNVPGSGAGSSYFGGQMDEVRIYNRALSASEIKSQYDLAAPDKTNTSASQSQGTGRLDSGLAGYWKLDETTGSSASDASTNGNTGTLNNMENGDWVAGQIGNGLTFDGVDEYGSVPDNNALDIGASQDFTISFWIKTTASPGSTKPLAKKEVNDNSVGWGFYQSTNGIYMKIGDGSSSLYDGISVPNINDGTWHLITHSVIRKGNCTRYRDAVIVGQTDCSSWASTDLSNSSSLYFGVNNIANGYWDGSLDEVRIYNRALSSDEVGQLYRLTTPTGTDTSLKGYWSFNGQDMSSTTAYDRSGAGNTGTLTNGPSIIEGKLGQALNFTAADDEYVSMGDINAVDGLTAITASVWAKGTGSGERHIFDKTSCLGTNNAGTFEIQTGGFVAGKASFLIYPADATPSSYVNIDSTVTVTDGAWHHIVGVYDGTSLMIYVDGVLSGSSALAGETLSSTSSVVEVGGNCNGVGSLNWDGSIDEARVYNRALSASEIKALYSSSR